MNLLMRPGSALLVLAVVAFLGTFVVGAVPVIGGFLTFLLWFATIFGAVGGGFLLYMQRRPAVER